MKKFNDIYNELLKDNIINEGVFSSITNGAKSFATGFGKQIKQDFKKPWEDLLNIKQPKTDSKKHTEITGDEIFNEVRDMFVSNSNLVDKVLIINGKPYKFNVSGYNSTYKGDGSNNITIDNMLIPIGKHKVNQKVLDTLDSTTFQVGPVEKKQIITIIKNIKPEKESK